MLFQGNSLWQILEAFGEDHRAAVFAMGLHHNLGFICIGEDLIKSDLFTAVGLEALVAHEVSHVYHNHLVKTLILTTIVSMLIDRMVSTRGFVIPDWWDYREIGFRMNALVYTLVAAWIYRCFEEEADMTAARIIDDPVALGKALEALKQNFREKPHLIYDLVTELFSNYPLLKNRKAYLKQAALNKEEQG